MRREMDAIMERQLVERRRRLEAAAGESTDSGHIAHLLQEVDSALDRLSAGSYGLCEVCQDPIEEELLMVDPLARACLDHLTHEQRRALEQDLELASRIQNRLLPRRCMSYGNWALCYHFEPAGPVSGDYCDVVRPETEGGDLLFLLGDVSGKGVAASMLMAHLNAIFRSLVAPGMAVDSLVEQANRVFCECTISSHYATLVCGRAKATGDLEICNAGHCAPLLIGKDGMVSLEPTGLPVGLFRSARYTSRTVRMGPGDSLLLYTDGLSEARDVSGAEYGVERLNGLTKGTNHLTARELVNACLGDLNGFLAGVPKGDDLALMVLKRLLEPVRD
jgi:sigma-B regulation protein RsbU (phosphoserine phosphatase)